MTCLGTVGSVMVRYGKVRSGRYGKVSSYEVRLGLFRHGEVWYGLAGMLRFCLSGLVGVIWG